MQGITTHLVAAGPGSGAHSQKLVGPAGNRSAHGAGECVPVAAGRYSQGTAGAGVVCCGRGRLVWLRGAAGVLARSGLVRLVLCHGRPVAHAGIASISIRAPVPLSGSYRGTSGLSGKKGQATPVDHSFRISRMFRANGTSGTGVPDGTSRGTFSRRPARRRPGQRGHSCRH